MRIPQKYAPVAQLDRVAVSEAVGRWFESSQVRHFYPENPFFYRIIFFTIRIAGFSIKYQEK